MNSSSSGSTGDVLSVWFSKRKVFIFQSWNWNEVIIFTLNNEVLFSFITFLLIIFFNWSCWKENRLLKMHKKLKFLSISQKHFIQWNDFRNMVFQRVESFSNTDITTLVHSVLLCHYITTHCYSSIVNSIFYMISWNRNHFSIWNYFPYFFRKFTIWNDIERKIIPKWFSFSSRKYWDYS